MYSKCAKNGENAKHLAKPVFIYLGLFKISASYVTNLFILLDTSKTSPFNEKQIVMLNIDPDVLKCVYFTF